LKPRSRHPGLDPGSTFFQGFEMKEEDGCRIKSGMTNLDFEASDLPEEGRR
jgi:hypothetical protein